MVFISTIKRMRSWFLLALTLLGTSSLSSCVDKPNQNDERLTGIGSVKLASRIYSKGKLLPSSEKDLDEIHTLLYNFDAFYQEKSLAHVSLILTKAKLFGLPYSDLELHRYDQFEDTIAAAGPDVDNERCILQLEELSARTEKQTGHDKFTSKDTTLARLLDTFGRVPSGIFMGGGFWLGEYDQCLRTKIYQSEDKSRAISTRYCIASLRPRTWPTKTNLDEILVNKIGVCLPSSCDSSNYKNKFQLIHRLIELNSRQVDLNQMNFTGLYCLPDEQSELRSIWQSSPAVAAIGLLIVWLAVLIYSTVKFELGHSGESTEILRSLSIVNNFRRLFCHQQSEQLSSHRAKPPSLVDLRSIEGIKVICMIYIITGHVLIFMFKTLDNFTEITHLWSPIYFMSNLLPAFAVNTFFTITGILTSYLQLKQNQKSSSITSPLKWMSLIIRRYLRIMPMYVLVTAYAKYLSKYAGSGPNWDYATSAISPRNICEQESWLWTLFYGANFKSPLEHCVPSAWYLANDFQFFLVTPIFILALYKWPRFGERLLIGSIIAGYLAGFLSVFLSDAPDLRPVANFMPHGFKTYINFLHSNYTRPMYRCPAYLVGLLLGYKLFSLEQKKLAHLKKLESSDEKINIESEHENNDLDKPDWSEHFKKYGLSWSILFVALFCLGRLAGVLFKPGRQMAKLLLSFFMPSLHLLFSLPSGFYILLASTGDANINLNRFLSSSFWKPLSTIGLCVMLINCEVITYFFHNSPRMHSIDVQYQFGITVSSVLASYLVALIAYIFFEAPIGATLDHLISFASSKLVAKRKIR